ncbi:MAG: hypothetical protein GSR80_000618 [Desulfurococcales archaeon]|nr:hypothetical protein [Desulfurococcales archaeon]
MASRAVAERRYRVTLEESGESVVYYEVDRERGERRICAAVAGSDYWRALAELLTFLAGAEDAPISDLHVDPGGGKASVRVVVPGGVYYDVWMETDGERARACAVAERGYVFGKPWETSVCNCDCGGY